MLQEAKDLQNSAVERLIEVVNNREVSFFKAPTGSGKTHMMAHFMNCVISDNPDVVFVVSSLSKGDLARQNYNNFEKYSSYEFSNLNPYLINSESSQEERIVIDLDYNVYVLPRDLYKEKSKLKESGAFVFFLEELKSRNKSIYLIKDECHIATGNLDSISSFFDRVINFSATPNLARNQVPDVVIDESEAVNAKLIKSVRYMDYLDEFDNEKSLDEALSFFEAEKMVYLESLKIKFVKESLII